MTDRQFYVDAESDKARHRAYVPPGEIVAEITRLLNSGFVKLSAELEREQAATSGALERARKAANG